MVHLRDHLLEALKTLPGTREFHIHALITAPRRNHAIFPFAIPRPRTYVEDILVLLSEQATAESPRKFVSAIEASVYCIQCTSCAIFYVSKVDSTGQGIFPSPTATLLQSLLLYYFDPETRPIHASHMWLHLFARAQGQYLFPNSADFPGKHPLTDVKLCAWWKRVLTQVAVELEKRPGGSGLIRLYYILPGYTQLEAEQSLKVISKQTVTNSFSWTYGHPYTQTEIPLPCPAYSREGANLGHFIPTFDDDPKSRFMDEIAYTTTEGVKSPARKRPRTDLSQRKVKVTEEADSEGSNNTDRPLGELGKVSSEEFWERMSFRQECVAGAVTGFFTLGCSLSVADNGHSSSTKNTASPIAPRVGQVPPKIKKRVMTTLMTGVEFSTEEHAVRGTEIVEKVIKGLCEGIESVPTATPSKVTLQPTLPHVAGTDRRTPDRDILPLPGSTSSLTPPSTPPRRRNFSTQSIPDISPNPFPDPETSLETYHFHIYASISVSNPASDLRRPGDRDKNSGDGSVQESGSTPAVTVLAVRKKKKKPE